jgi:hypothetical protein
MRDEKKYEYTIVSKVLNYPNPTLESVLNGMGDAGWVLVNIDWPVANGADTITMFVLMREKRCPSTP